MIAFTKTQIYVDARQIAVNVFMPRLLGSEGHAALILQRRTIFSCSVVR